MVEAWAEWDLVAVAQSRADQASLAVAMNFRQKNPQRIAAISVTALAWLALRHVPFLPRIPIAPMKSLPQLLAPLPLRLTAVHSLVLLLVSVARTREFES